MNGERFAEVNGTRLCYEVAGSSHPLVLVHGFTLDKSMWDDQFSIFAERYEVIRYDLRGHGKSAMPGAEGFYHADDLSHPRVVCLARRCSTASYHNCQDPLSWKAQIDRASRIKVDRVRRPDDSDHHLLAAGAA
jgi:pimeloyl-ACP methyl ester carboxylesterase